MSQPFQLTLVSRAGHIMGIIRGLILILHEHKVKVWPKTILKDIEYYIYLSLYMQLVDIDI